MSDLIPRLLAGRNRLSRLEKEAMFERIAARTRPAKKRFYLPAFGLALAGAAALAIFVRTTPPEFASRGSAQASFRVACAGGHCRTGDKLVFEVHTTASAPYFAAFARSQSGLVIWYFPDREDGRSIDARGGVLERAVVLGPEHAPGRYEIFSLMSDHPLGRDEVKRAVESGSTHLLRQDFEVEK